MEQTILNLFIALRRRIGRIARGLGFLSTSHAPAISQSEPQLSPVALVMLGMLSVREQEPHRGLRVVQIGANPSDGDPIQPIFQLLGPDSRMLLIEAHPAAYERLQRKYSGDNRVTLVNAFVGRSGDVLYALKPEFEAAYQEVKKRPADRMSSGNYLHLFERVAARLKLDANAAQEAIEIVDTPVKGLEEICYENGFNTFDVLQIDAEGKDGEILADFDPRKFECYAINYESAYLPDKKVVSSRLESLGFLCVADSGDSLFLSLEKP